MKILHTADLHLREYGDRRWAALQKVIKLGKDEGIGLCVICGDLFDKDINAEELRPKIRDIFSSNGFPIVIIPGNHDRESFDGGLYFGEDAVVLTDLKSPYILGDIAVWGIPFEHIAGDRLLQRLNEVAGELGIHKINILLYHGELIDSLFSRKDFGDEGDGRYMPVKLSYFSDLGFDYILAGHFHTTFEFWSLKNGGYFVYPGSPVSITKKETGRRNVNIFQPGGQPKGYALDTAYYEHLLVEYDPFNTQDPLAAVKELFCSLPPEAMGILTVRGFVNGMATGLTESKLIAAIKGIASGRCVEERYELRDIGLLLEDGLFKEFIKRLEDRDFQRGRKGEIRELAIKAMMGVTNCK